MVLRENSLLSRTLEHYLFDEYASDDLIPLSFCGVFLSASIRSCSPSLNVLDADERKTSATS